MSLRKNRVPLQGLSNFRLTQNDWKVSMKNIWNPIEQVKQKTFNLQQNIPKNVPTFQNIQKIKKKVDLLQINENRALTQIRHAYKGKVNIWRLAKAWKFDQKGFITTADLKNKLQNIMKVNITAQQQKLLNQKFGNSEGKIDIQNFLKILYHQNEGASYKPKLYNINDQNKARLNKIDNLIEKADNYKSAFKKTHQQIDLTNQLPQQKISLNKTKWNQINKKFGKTQQSMTQKQKVNHFNDKCFFSLTQQSFNKVKSTSKHKNMHPQTMFNLNQTKTRFGATVRPSKDFNIFHTGDQSNYCNKTSISVTPNFSAIQKEQKKLKMIKRIQKIRQRENIQKQNVQKIEAKEMDKNIAKLTRKKLEKQAYQYSAFLRNKWL